MARAWPALDIHVPGCDPELRELVFAELDDFHPSAIQEPEDLPRLRAFFVSAESRDAAARALGSAFTNHLYVETIEVEDEDWAARSQAALRAVTIGRIVVAPPWDAGAPDPMTIVIQPSMGFGTGHHATTRLMLKALQSIPTGGLTVLDIGCGSGVLAIAAVRLGAQGALGVDIDVDAVASAMENLELNHAGDGVTFEEKDFRDISSPVAIALANLTGALLERSAATLADLVEPGGYLITSGFMESESRVIPALQQRMTLHAVHQEDEWMCAVFQKQPT